MDILGSFETRNRSQIIYIAVASMSNALGSVIAANVSRPVISCPSFADNSDYMVNIHSTLQIPCNVPMACILRPDNTASFCNRLFSLS